MLQSRDRLSGQKLRGRELDRCELLVPLRDCGNNAVVEPALERADVVVGVDLFRRGAAQQFTCCEVEPFLELCTPAMGDPALEELLENPHDCEPLVVRWLRGEA